MAPKKFKRHTKRKVKRKGFKRKGFKKTDKQQIVKRIHFPIGQRVVPDQLEVTLPYDFQFTIPAGQFIAGAVNYMNVTGSTFVNPLASPGGGPTLVPYSQAAAPGLNGTANTGFTVANSAWTNAMLTMYRNWYVKSSAIMVDVEIGGQADASDLHVIPISSNNQNVATAQLILESRYLKSAKIGVFSFGMDGNRSNTIKHFMSQRRLLGINVSDQVLMQTGTYSGSGTGTQPSINWLWQIALNPRDDLVNAAVLGLRIRLKYYCIFYNPATQSS